jgi:hypothetical protein
MRKVDVALLLAGFAAIAFGVGTVAWAINGTAPAPAASASSAGGAPGHASGRFTVGDGRFRFDYELDRAETRIEGVLTMTGEQLGVSEGGAVLTLHYLSNGALDSFKRTYGASSKFPAPFFNRHAERRILIPATPAVERRLRRIDFPDYRSTADWRRFELRGFCIRSAPVVSLNGKPGRLPINMFDGCLTLVATGLTVGSEPVATARR